jgi:SAM-dependent methyltransferase
VSPRQENENVTFPAPDRVSQARSFGPAAASYERGRPPYPAKAVDWLLPPAARTVLDLGAGTGKLTRMLAQRGLEVIAIDPSAGMVAELARVLPAVPAAVGAAEQLPLRAGSVDAVLVAQAWHWVDPGRAVPAVARVLRPGGWLGVVWNVRDEREEWVARLGQIMHQDPQLPTYSTSPPIGPPFAAVERADIHWTYRLSLDQLLDLVASRSSVITMPPDRREAVLAEVRALVQANPALDPADIALPYVTRCARTRLS